MRLLSLQRGVENSKLFSNDARLLYTCRSFRRGFRFGFIFLKSLYFWSDYNWRLLFAQVIGFVEK